MASPRQRRLVLDADFWLVHEDHLEVYSRLMGAAHAQPEPGRFKSIELLESLIGPGSSEVLQAHGDIVVLRGGVIAVPGVGGNANRVLRCKAKRRKDMVTMSEPEDMVTISDTVSMSPKDMVTISEEDMETISFGPKDTVTISPKDTPSMSFGPPSRARDQVSSISSREATTGNTELGKKGVRGRKPTESQLVHIWFTDHGLNQPSGWAIKVFNDAVRGLGAATVIGFLEEGLEAGNKMPNNLMRFVERRSENGGHNGHNGFHRPVTKSSGHTRSVDEVSAAFDRPI